MNVSLLRPLSRISSVPPLQRIQKSAVPIAGYTFIAGLAVAIAVRFLIIALLAPATDVFYYDQQAAQTLLAGANPYTHNFAGIPSSLVSPGAERVFAYLPFTAIYLIPFYLLGDVRLGFLVADVVIGFCLYMLGGRWSTLSSLVFLLTPFSIIFSTLYINNSLVSMAFLSLFLLFEKRGKRLSAALAMGVSLASIQLMWILFPFLAYYLVRSGRVRDLAVGILVPVAIVLPFAIWSLPDFISDTIVFQFARPTLDLINPTGPLGYSINPSLNGFLLAFANSTLPFLVRLGAMVILLPLFLRRARSMSDVLLRGGLFTLISVFVLPNNFFWVYTELPFLVLLARFSVESSLRRPQSLKHELASWASHPEKGISA